MVDAVAPLRDALIGKLEDLPADDFKRLERQLRGVIINREQVVFIKPNIEYFAGLAAQYGDEADRMFFAAMKATYPDSVWPVYIEQQTGPFSRKVAELIDRVGGWLLPLGREDGEHTERLEPTKVVRVDDFGMGKGRPDIAAGASVSSR